MKRSETSSRALLVNSIPRVTTNGKLFPLPFDSLSAAQSFADLLNKRPHLPAVRLDPHITLKSGQRLTQTQWHNHLAGKSPVL